MKGFDGNTTSGKNMKTVSLNKRIAADGIAHSMFNNTIDLMQQMHPGLQNLNNTALLQQQLNSQFANRQMIEQARSSIQPKTTTNRWSKHLKAFSMVPGQFDIQTGLQLNQPNQIPFSGRTPATDQFLNLPVN